jgi:hypothetical protein
MPTAVAIKYRSAKGSPYARLTKYQELKLSQHRWDELHQTQQYFAATFALVGCVPSPAANWSNNQLRLLQSVEAISTTVD